LIPKNLSDSLEHSRTFHRLVIGREIRSFLSVIKKHQEEEMYTHARSISIKMLLLFAAAALLFSSFAFVPAAYAQASCGDSIKVVSGDTLNKIAVRCGTTVSALLRANPDIKDRNRIYPGQVLIMPGALIPGTGATDTYVVQRGDTLLKLANRFNTTIERLLELNKDITNRNVIYEGQRLAVPNGRTPAPSPAPAPGQTYTVVRGDTLRKIASRFDTTVDVLLKLNPDIKDANKIYVGQKIVLPESASTYTVVRGDTLRIIANRFNTTVAKLLELNPTISDPNKIFVGQVIRIK
jgi:LysM repeat protein